MVSSAGNARKGAASAWRPGASEWRIGDASTGARKTPVARRPARASPRPGGGPKRKKPATHPKELAVAVRSPPPVPVVRDDPNIGEPRQGDRDDAEPPDAI